ncbi:MAG: hypothetical protein P4L82_23245 [Ancalomicrobiaceae bacterium]|nr:hypothetical protein [Ancalomicrobiaceae bacterium]
MLRNTIFAAAATAALAVAAVVSAAPAEAQYWHHPYYGHHRPEFRDRPYFAPRADCYWTWRRVRVWTDHGPRWVRQQVRVCG